ncbi:MAG: single-stranded DNA-binding protein [Clostridium sp.]|uniref:single-stranded DNA-binding protein n=1 Tax=Clostridium sp. TaxID=1506 RepID=UPI003F347B08
MNKVILTGNLTKDLELRFSKDKGTPYVRGMLAVHGFKKDSTNFIPFAIFNKKAEVLATYAKKGAHIAIFGELERKAYFSEKDETNIYKTTVLADNFEFINSSRKKTNDEKSLNNEDLDSNELLEELALDSNLPF